jgi:hypothetical protein
MVPKFSRPINRVRKPIFFKPRRILRTLVCMTRCETESPALFGPTRPSCPPQPARGETSACATERETATQACAKPIRGGRHRLLSRVELGLAGFFFFLPPPNSFSPTQTLLLSLSFLEIRHFLEPVRYGARTPVGSELYFCFHPQTNPETKHTLKGMFEATTATVGEAFKSS